MARTRIDALQRRGREVVSGTVAGLHLHVHDNLQNDKTQNPSNSTA